MEEQQIEEFVRCAFAHEAVRNELVSDPAGAIARQEFSPRVASIILRLTPYLTLEEPMAANPEWWHA